MSSAIAIDRPRDALGTGEHGARFRGCGKVTYKPSFVSDSLAALVSRVRPGRSGRRASETSFSIKF